MRLIRLSLLAVFIVPVLFVMGTIASQAATLGPIQLGAYYQFEFDKIAQQGANLKALTEGLTKKEIDILYRIINRSRIQDVFNNKIDNLKRISNLTGRCV